ncbi:MAG TPA: hypothetical protein VGV64_01100 [Thermoplasmata archaeon]|nr:hypothetical protein [Thermoplasmata archaeon]
MTDPGEAPPTYRTGTLWLVLALILLVGTVASAFVVYGITGALSTGRWLPGLPIALVGGAIAVLAMLFVTGLLYRVDRLRGVPHKEVRLFE